MRAAELRIARDFRVPPAHCAAVCAALPGAEDAAKRAGAVQLTWYDALIGSFRVASMLSGDGTQRAPESNTELETRAVRAFLATALDGLNANAAAVCMVPTVSCLLEAIAWYGDNQDVVMARAGLFQILQMRVLFMQAGPLLAQDSRDLAFTISTIAHRKAALFDPSKKDALRSSSDKDRFSAWCAAVVTQWVAENNPSVVKVLACVSEKRGGGGAAQESRPSPSHMQEGED
jgi:hypothetical protein